MIVPALLALGKSRWRDAFWDPAVDVAASANPGSSSITIRATVAGAPAPKTQSFTLVLTQPTAFPAVKSGHNGSGPIRVSAIDAFSAAVGLTCSFPTTHCTVTPSSVSSYPTNPSVTVDGTGLVGAYQMTVTGTSGPNTHTLSIPFNIGSFAMSVAIPPDPVLAGQSSKATLSLIPSFGYTGTIALTCNVAAISGARCTLNPAGPIIISNSNPAQFNATLTYPQAPPRATTA